MSPSFPSLLISTMLMLRQNHTGRSVVSSAAEDALTPILPGAKDGKKGRC